MVVWQNRFWAGVLLLAICGMRGALAQPISDAELTRRQAQQQEQAQSRATPSPNVFTPSGAGERAAFSLPAESPCFVIHELAWHGAEAFAWLAEDSPKIAGACVGAQGLRAWQDYLSNQLIEQGYVTSRVLLPEQNLASGRLVVQVLAGRIGQVREEGDVPGFFRMALDRQPGDLLNQRDLDQALENIRRLGGQAEVTFDLVPGEEQGETDIVVKHPAARRWRGQLTLDDSGSDSTGKYQAGVILSIDSPLHLYDTLSLALNHNLNYGNASLGSNSSSINWSVPFGYWNFLLGANQSRYRQTVAGFSGDIEYSGHSYGMEIGLGYVLGRTSSAKTTAQFKLNRKVSRSNIDDTEIDVQFRDVVGYDFDLSHRQYLGDSTLDLSIGVHGSLPRQSHEPGVVVGQPGWDGRYQVQTAGIGLTVPFRVGEQALRYQGNLRIQHAPTVVPSFEYFSIGNRYSVRGFDGDNTLAAEDGWTLRNELALQLGGSGQECFVGLDAGRVNGPSAATLLGRSLVGAVLGLRGRLNRFNYEITIGSPLHKPAGFQTENPTFTASLGAEF